MNKTNCGSCNWHDEIKQKRTYCLFYDRWLDVNQKCENFVEYSYINREERSRRASEARERVDAKEREEREKQEAERRAQEDKRHAEEIARLNREHAEELQQMRMKFDTRMWWQTLWWQFILALISAGLGFLAGWFLKP
jgi:ABC-type sugar transport system permease subunit